MLLKEINKSDLIDFISQFSQGMKNIAFWVNFVPENSKKLQKLGLEGKIRWALNVCTLPNLKKFNFENVKNEECVHTQANGTRYTSIRL
jgi:hypothetical protein